MLKKITLWGFVFVFLMALTTAKAFAEGADSQTGTFTINVNAVSLTLTPSAGVYLSVDVNSSALDASVRANVAAVHGKGNIKYGMDSDGGGLWTSTGAPPLSEAVAPNAVSGTADWATNWTAP